MTTNPECQGVFTSIDEANAIKAFLDHNKFQSLDITQFADYIFIRPKGDSLKNVETLKKFLEIQNEFQSVMENPRLDD